MAFEIQLTSIAARKEPPMHVVLASLTVFYLFYGTLAVSAIFFKKVGAVVVSKGTFFY